MTTAIDTNVLVALWDADDALHPVARKALEGLWSAESLLICGVVYAELVGAPLRTEDFIDRFCEETGISVQWDLGESVWRAAGRAFQDYAGRRKKHGGPQQRRVLADFVIGAHAAENRYKLLTADAGVYERAFPKLRVRII